MPQALGEFLLIEYQLIRHKVTLNWHAIHCVQCPPPYSFEYSYIVLTLFAVICCFCRLFIYFYFVVLTVL